MRPYLSIDIEYSGRDVTRAEVLELALVLDDGIKAVSSLDQGAYVIKYEQFGYAEPNALLVNERLIKAQMNTSIKKYSPRELFDSLKKATIYAAQDVCYNWDAQTLGHNLAIPKVALAGKDIGSVVVPMLTNFFIRHGVDKEAVAEWKSYLSERYLDIPSLYFPHFDFVPSMSKVNKLTGRPSEEKYNSLEDALDMVCAIRNIRGIPYQGVS